MKKCKGQEWESAWGECGKVCWGVWEVKRQVWGCGGR